MLECYIPCKSSKLHTVFAQGARLLLICVLALLGSCDTHQPIDFQFSNNTDSTLSLNYRVRLESGQLSPETTIVLAAHQNTILFRQEVISNTVYNPLTGSDTVRSLQSLIVRRPDNSQCSKRYLLSKEWVFVPRDEHYALLEFWMENSDL